VTKDLAYVQRGQHPLSRVPVRFAQDDKSCMTIIKRCAVCSRFRAYDEDDRYCVVCGHDGLAAECECGRVYDYLVPEDESAQHCPRCGTVLRGRQREYDA